MRIVAVGVVLVASLRCASAPPSRQEHAVLVGVAAIDITPEEPIRLTGYGNGSRSASTLGCSTSYRARSRADEEWFRERGVHPAERIRSRHLKKMSPAALFRRSGAV